MTNSVILVALELRVTERRERRKKYLKNGKKFPKSIEKH